MGRERAEPEILMPILGSGIFFHFSAITLSDRLFVCYKCCVSTGQRIRNVTVCKKKRKENIFLDTVCPSGVFKKNGAESILTQP